MSYTPIDDLRPGDEPGGGGTDPDAAPRAEATITVDAGADGTTARPVGWGHVHWLTDFGVTILNALDADTIDEREELPPPPGAPTFVDAGEWGNGSATTMTMSFTSAAEGNLIVAQTVNLGLASISLANVTGATTIEDLSDGVDRRLKLAHGIRVATNPTQTVGVPSDFLTTGAAYSGAAAAPVSSDAGIVGTTVGYTVAGTTIQLPGVTTTNPNSILVWQLAADANGGAVTVDNGTIRTQNADAFLGGRTQIVVDRICVAAGAQAGLVLTTTNDVSAGKILASVTEITGV